MIPTRTDGQRFRTHRGLRDAWLDAPPLADGISQSMNATIIGIAVGVIGMAVLVVSLVVVARARDRS